MLEIGAIIYLCSRMRNLLHDRGWDKTGWMQALVVIVYLFSLGFGAFVYALVVAFRRGEAGFDSIGFMIYPPALLSAVLGQIILFAVVKSVVRKPEPAEAIPAFYEELSPLEVEPELMVRSLAHSRLGIASFAISCLAAMSSGILIIMIGIKESANPGTLQEEHLLLVGLAFFGLIGLTLVGLALGIAGLVRQGRRRIFAVLGVVIALLNGLGFGTIVALG